MMHTSRINTQSNFTLAHSKVQSLSRFRGVQNAGKTARAFSRSSLNSTDRPASELVQVSCARSFLVLVLDTARTSFVCSPGESAKKENTHLK